MACWRQLHHLLRPRAIMRRRRRCAVRRRMCRCRILRHCGHVGCGYPGGTTGGYAAGGCPYGLGGGCPHIKATRTIVDGLRATRPQLDDPLTHTHSKGVFVCLCRCSQYRRLETPSAHATLHTAVPWCMKAELRSTHRWVRPYVTLRRAYGANWSMITSAISFTLSAASG